MASHLFAIGRQAQQVLGIEGRHQNALTRRSEFLFLRLSRRSSRLSSKNFIRFTPTLSGCVNQGSRQNTGQSASASAASKSAELSWSRRPCTHLCALMKLSDRQFCQMQF